MCYSDLACEFVCSKNVFGSKTLNFSSPFSQKWQKQITHNTGYLDFNIPPASLHWQPWTEILHFLSEFFQSKIIMKIYKISVACGYYRQLSFY